MRLGWISLACVIALVAACRGEPTPIFDWVELRSVAGAPARPPGAGGEAGSGVAGGQAVTTAGTGMPGEAGAGGRVSPGVHFDWTETLPGRGACSGAVFVGSFNCTVQNSLPTRLDGTIVLTLVGPSEQQQLDASSGIIAVSVDPSQMTAITAPVKGKVVCSNNRSFLGEVPSTMLTAAQTGVLFQVFSGLLCASNNMATGTLVGTLDADALSLLGEISLVVGSCNCVGTFDLRAQR